MPPVTARAVAAALADHRRRLAGDRGLVDARDALDHVAVAGDQLAAPRRRPRRPCGAPRPGPSRCRPSRAGARSSPCASAQRVGLRLAAALGDRLGEVREEHREPEPGGDRAGEPERQARPGSARSRRAARRAVVRTLPTSTTNITGFLAIGRGASLRTLSSAARGRICAVEERDGACAGTGHGIASGQKSFPFVGEEVLDDRAERERGEEGERADDHDDAHEQHGEERAVGREGAEARGHDLLADHRAGDARAPGRSSGSGRSSMVRPSVVSHHGVLAFRPAKAEPLLPPPLE